MKTLWQRLALTAIGVIGISTPAIAATFNGTLDIQLQVDIDQLSLFTIENGAGGTSSSNSNEMGTGMITQLLEPSSTPWGLDPTFSFIQLDYQGGTIGGNSGDDGLASATVSGTSNRLIVTNISGQMQEFEITGTFSADLNTVIGNPETEMSELELEFNLVTDLDQTLGTFSQSLSDTDSFTATDQEFNISSLTLEAGQSQTVYIESTSQAEAYSRGKEIPEPDTTIIGLVATLGIGAVLKKEKLKIQKKKS